MTYKPKVLEVAAGGTGDGTLTNHGVLIGQATSAIAATASGSAGQVLQSGGASADPVYSTATYPSSTTINQILYSSSANVVSGLATANSAVLATNGSGIPSITATPTVTSITFGTGTALSNYAEGTWTPTIVGQSVAGTTTYVAQAGYYTRIGNLVTIFGTVTYTAATGTGNLLIGGFPFTIKNQSNYFPTGAVAEDSSGTIWPAGRTHLTLLGLSNTTTANIYCSGSAVGAAYFAMTNAASGWEFTLTYQI